MNVTIDIPKSEITGMLRQVKAWELRKHGQLRQAIAKTALAIEKTAKESMSHKGRGRLYTNRGAGLGDHQASAPGDPPATDTGRLRASIKSDLTDLVRLAAEVGTNVEYGRHLEYGTVNMAARPWLKPAYDKHIPGFLKEITKILSTL